MTKYLIIILLLLFVFLISTNISKTSVPKKVSQEKPYVNQIEKKAEPNTNGDETAKIDQLDITNATDEPQTLSDLVWKDYKNEDLGVSFTYPDNLNSICHNLSGSSLKVSPKDNYFIARMSVCENMGYIVDIVFREKWEDSIEKWVDQSSLLNGTRTLTTFKDTDAIFYKVTEEQQIPSDIFIFKHKDYIVTVGIMRTGKENVFEGEIVNRILDSINFY